MSGPRGSGFGLLVRRALGLDASAPDGVAIDAIVGVHSNLMQRAAELARANAARKRAASEARRLSKALDGAAAELVTMGEAKAQAEDDAGRLRAELADARARIVPIEALKKVHAAELDEFRRQADIRCLAAASTNAGGYLARIEEAQDARAASEAAAVALRKRVTALEAELAEVRERNSILKGINAGRSAERDVARDDHGKVLMQMAAFKAALRTAAGADAFASEEQLLARVAELRDCWDDARAINEFASKATARRDEQRARADRLQGLLEGVRQDWDRLAKELEAERIRHNEAIAERDTLRQGIGCLADSVGDIADALKLSRWSGDRSIVRRAKALVQSEARLVAVRAVFGGEA